MRKLFKRREFLYWNQRSAVEAFGVAWIVRSWLDPTWGEAGGLLWWFNLALASAVVLAMCTLVVTKPKRRPTFQEQLSEHLKRHDLQLITREMAARIPPPPLLGMPIVESPFVPKGQFFAVNPSTLSDMIAKADPTQFRFKTDYFSNPRRCPVTWTSSDGRCSDSDAGDGIHHCSRGAGHSERGDACRCNCGASTLVPWEQIAKDQINPTTGKAWCWCLRKNCEGCTK